MRPDAGLQYPAALPAYRHELDWPSLNQDRHAMKFDCVGIAGIARILPPNELTSAQIDQRLAPAYARLGLRPGMLQSLAGIRARRLWDHGTQPSQVASIAAQAALADANLSVSSLDLLINASVSRDFLEPATASIIAGTIQAPPTCLSFDLSNACLGFVNAMDVAAMMIENGRIEHALVVAGETAEPLYEATLSRLLREDATSQDFRDNLASLTIGSAAVAMVLSRASVRDDIPMYRGGLSRSANQFHGLCRGTIDRMHTDAKALMGAGLDLAAATMADLENRQGWLMDEFDCLAVHQVSSAHTDAVVKVLGLDRQKIHTIFQDEGNIGPAGIPVVLQQLRESGQMTGSRVGILGIGSGLNCMMAQVDGPHLQLRPAP